MLKYTARLNAMLGLVDYTLPQAYHRIFNLSLTYRYLCIVDV